MAAKPLTTEAIALTEKKMDMTLGVLSFSYLSLPFSYHLCSLIINGLVSTHLDDIIKMSKNNTSGAKKQRRAPVRIVFSFPPSWWAYSVSVMMIGYDIYIKFFSFFSFVQNKNESFLKSSAQDKSRKMRRFMDSRSSLRQV